jgi:hypothetical protein
MQYLFFAVFCLIGALPLFANPIAIDSSRRPISMISENVIIDVSSGSSRVHGTYTFRQEQDDWPEEADNHVIVFVPILLPDKPDEDRNDPPEVVVGNKRFRGQIRNDIALNDTPRSDVKLPKGWRMAIYESSIPLKLLKQTFSVEVFYTQSHFDGDISGYVPINPPKSKEAAIITFRATSGFILKKTQMKLFGQPAKPAIKFTPEDRQLISVKCKKVSGN